MDVTGSLVTLHMGGQVQSVDGVPMWKLHEDMDRYATVIAASRPEVIVETGTMWGGSALWFEQHGPDVITIDTTPWPIAPQAYAQCQRTTWITGSSTDPGVLDQVRERIGGRRCMVSLDSDHSAPHVADEIRAYGPLVTPGCYLVVEDGIFDLAPTDQIKALGGALIPVMGGPLRAIAAELADNPLWTRDVDIERAYPLSYYPAGWWVKR